MARKFIAILGTGSYKSCVYSNGKEKVESRFIQKAIIDMYMKDIKPEDKIVIFLTDEARRKNWYDAKIKRDGIKTFFEKNCPKRLEDAEKMFENETNWDDFVEKTVGLEKVLKESYPKENIEDPVSIKDGKSEEEIWSIFEKIYNHIDNNDEIIFDITHGFRSIPMLALTVLNYAKVIKNIKILGIYYGAYEVPGNEKPIFDLTSYSEILNWTDAVNTFVKYGNSNVIKDVFDESKNRNNKIKVLTKFIKELNDLTNCIDMSRGRVVEKSECKDNKKRMEKSTHAAAIGVKEQLEKIDEEKESLIIPLKPLFKEIGKNINSFYNASNFEVGMATIKWCKENNLIQNAYTALDETIKTYVCDKYGISNLGKENRDDIVKYSINYIANNISSDKEEIKKNPRHISDKTKSSIMDIKEDDTEEEIKNKKEKFKIIEKIVNTIPINLANLSDKVSKHRNDMNHFGFSNAKNTSQYSTLMKDIDELFEQFEEFVKDYDNKDFTK